MQTSDYSIIAFYHFCPIPDPAGEVASHKQFFINRDVRARTYISTQGINGQMSASKADGEAYMEWLRSRPEFQGVEFKIDPYHEHVFPRLTIKVKKELVALGEELTFEQKASYLEPRQWGEMLETCEDKVLLDIRNDYEWKIGRFEGAEQVTCETFRDFIDMAQDLKKKLEGKPTKVMMYCTGGIRCEVFSALLKKEGMQNEVYQLHGGVIRYGHEEKSKHWLGKLFVFDDRLQVDISDEKAPSIGECLHCKGVADNYYNCANVGCNKLFMCCIDCLEKVQGCCQASCETAERVRPFQFAHKPFRRWYNYREQAPASTQKVKEVACTL